MWFYLYQYFRDLIYSQSAIDDDGSFLENLNLTNFDVNGDGSFIMPFGDWLAMTLSFIAFVFVVVLCCLFIYRLIRLVGRLFSGGAL